MKNRKNTRKKAKVIIITGTPGVGKSTFALFLSKKLYWRRLDLHSYYNQLSTGYNRKKQCYDLDPKRVEKLVIKTRDEDTTPLVVDSHIAHHLSPKNVDLCIVLTCSDLQKLKQRLLRRQYSKQKIRENLDAEIFQICLIEAQENKHKILVFDNIHRKDFLKISKKLSILNII